MITLSPAFSHHQKIKSCVCNASLYLLYFPVRVCRFAVCRAYGPATAHVHTSTSHVPDPAAANEPFLLRTTLQGSKLRADEALFFYYSSPIFCPCTPPLLMLMLLRVDQSLCTYWHDSIFLCMFIRRLLLSRFNSQLQQTQRILQPLRMIAMGIWRIPMLVLILSSTWILGFRQSDLWLGSLSPQSR